MKIITLQYQPCFEKPSSEEMLNYDVLELHEAAFWLTYWPNTINKCFYPKNITQKNITRTFFYLAGQPPEYQGVSYPSCLDSRYPDISKKDCLKIAQDSAQKWVFNPTDMGKEFLNILNAMKEAIKSGELEASAETLYIGDVYGENISYFLSPFILLKWVLLRGFGLSDDIQKTENLYVIKGKPTAAMQRKIKNQTVYQFLKEDYPEKSNKEHYEHPWMKMFGTADESEGEEYGAIRKATANLRKKRPQGAISKEDRAKDIKNSDHLKVIEEVVSTDSENLKRYNIPSLRIAIKTASNILLEKFNKEFYPEVNVGKFLEYFINNKVVSLYTRRAHPIILELIETFAYEAVADFFMYHEFVLSMKNAGNFYSNGKKIE